MIYQHRLLSQAGSESLDLPVGKVVCVGRNYAAHAAELNNPVPAEPILFMKPATAVVSLENGWSIPTDQGDCHIETEMTLLIGSQLSKANEQQALAAILGVGIGFDLTLRDVQTQLKQQGHPWERAKAFDGSCPLSSFVDATGFELSDAQLRLTRNGELQQDGNSADMITPVAKLLALISQQFTLMPGDVVLTGTPAGVGAIQAGDLLEAELNQQLKVECRVR
ncbi:MAG: isomerase/hydrolase [Cellvibrionaceae bacterium]|nr:isomerase/hydrolase [Cellvibrionaceae bacterium]